MGVRLNGKDIAGLVQCAEAGMNQTEAAETLELSPTTVQRASVQYNIKFHTYRERDNGRRKQSAMDSSKSAKPPHQHNGNGKPTKSKPFSSAKARRVIDAIGNDKQRDRREAIEVAKEKEIDEKNQKRINDILNCDRPAWERFEMIYFIKFLAREKKYIRQGKRPPFPHDRYGNWTNWKKTCAESVRKRDAIMSKLDCNEFKIAADIAFEAKLSVKSCSQMLDVLFRQGEVDRRHVQRKNQENRHKKIYEYVKIKKGENL